MADATRQALARLAGVLAVLFAGTATGATVPLSLRVGDLGRTILACWTPPAGGGAVTIALSVRRDGTMIGIPRVTYLQPGRQADPQAGDARTLLVTSIAAAVRQCTPVRLSPALQRILPGQILRLRFTAAPGAATGTVSTIWSGT